MSLEQNKENIFNIGEGEGASGSFFFFSYDKKFIFKTITPDELKVFNSYLDQYARHLSSPCGSIISVILGVYTLKMSGLVPVHLILMKNSLPRLQSYVHCELLLY